jgi:hypothetical protein
VPASPGFPAETSPQATAASGATDAGVLMLLLLLAADNFYCVCAHTRMRKEMNSGGAALANPREKNPKTRNFSRYRKSKIRLRIETQKMKQIRPDTSSDCLVFLNTFLLSALQSWH